NGRRFRTFNVIDHYNRQCYGILNSFSIPARKATAFLDRLIEKYGKPERIRGDNGPELMAKWFKTWLRSREIQWSAIPKGSPQQNAIVERFNSSTEPTAKTFWMPTSSFQSTMLNRAPINGLKNTTPIESMRHLDIKPRQPMQHKGFFRHTPSGMVLKKKGDEQLTALQTTFRRENLSLAGCSSAEPASVSVQQ